MLYKLSKNLNFYKIINLKKNLLLNNLPLKNIMIYLELLLFYKKKASRTHTNIL